MSTYDDFEIEVQHPAEEVVLLKLGGELDLCTSVSLMESIADAITERPALIAVDLGDVRFMDGTGVKVLESAAHHIDAGQTRFAVICPSTSQVTRVLQAAGLHRELHIHESTREALGPWLGDEDEDPSTGETVLV